MSIVATREDGVRLAPLEVWQAEAFAAHLDRAREHIRPWVGPAFVTYGVNAARETIRRYAERAADDRSRLLGLWDGDRLLGGVMFVDLDAVSGIGEMGCWLEPEAEGRGLVTWACGLLADWFFDVRGLHRLEWRCRADNERSQAVARRLGMTLEGTLRRSWLNGGEHHDKQVWALLDDERARRHLSA